MNLLSLVTPCLDNVCQIKTKYYSTKKQKILRTKQGLSEKKGGKRVMPMTLAFSSVYARVN